MNRLDQIDPYLTADDEVARKFALRTIRNFPAFKPEWPERLIRAAMDHPEDPFDFLMPLSKMEISAGDVPLLIEAAMKAKQEKRHLFTRPLESLPLELKIRFQHELRPLFTNKEQALQVKLIEADQAELDQLFEMTLEKAEAKDEYDHRLYTLLKSIAHRQFRQGWIDEEEVRRTLQQQMEQRWFDYKGIITVYKIGLLMDTSYIPQLVPLLSRNEEILAEEVESALTAFQSDEVVRAVEPLAYTDEAISALTIIENTYSGTAISTFKKLYSDISDIDLKSITVNGLATRLAEEGRPEIEHFMEYPDRGRMIEADEMAYGYFTIMGFDHPKREQWRQEARMREERFKQIAENSNFLIQQPVTSGKIGRNDPCPCGSGKKYKKCCGK